ncbi:lactonase family protein [Spirosoma utsteinense]|uniref:6-phosphogluconolactonase n=1 Tax=Spirosoma utsteinense TaxID=2585773 RepID=A0ABR6W2J6_9BACT|nr:lactonase family protein [Spirosoma utsteinense]MBC3784392.1 6-phosphogluconolactonase [Spirosoma utsteinense]MBC3790809.1 6-phosphogluconolactonase [Spirosoma utsteinense]
MYKLLTGLVMLLTNLGMTAYAQHGKEIIYVGTYSVRGSEGIYVYEFDRMTGAMNPLQSVSNAKSPSFLALHPSTKYLYSVNEAAETGPSKAGAVSAYRVDGTTGKLTFLNSQSTLGNGPCYVSIDQTGKTAFVANYGGGSMAVLPINLDGNLGAATDSVQQTGRGPDAKRQEKPHIHSATVSPDNRFVYVADLGTDKLHIYEIDAKNSTVKPAQTPYVTVKPGSGPRHLAFHPNGKFAYLAEELISSVAVFSRNAKTGALTLIRDGVKTLPADFSEQNTSADIHIDPTGKFLYQSNRGRHALAIFAIGDNGDLTAVGDEPTRGKTPRNFMIDPKGEFVFVANQDSDTITIFKRNQKTGKLTYTGQSISVPAPVCVIMAGSR